MKKYDQLQNSFITWANNSEDIKAAIKVGSRARRDHPADELADLDIMIFSTKPEFYISNTEWIKEIGHVWMIHPSVTVGGDPEQLVIFEGGYNVDFVFIHNNDLKGYSESGPLPEIYQRGSEVLVDKESMVSPILPSSFRSPTYQKPTQEEFLSGVNAFWMFSAYHAKILRRGNLFRVKLIESKLREGLHDTIALHTHVTRGWDIDTWHDGNFIEEWADQRILENLPHIYSKFDLKDCWRAQIALMDFMRWVNKEIAAKLDYDYPQFADETATELVNKLYSESINL